MESVPLNRTETLNKFSGGINMHIPVRTTFLTTMVLALVVLFTAGAFAGSPVTDEWSVPISVTFGTTNYGLTFGTKIGATDEFDPGVDTLAPPPPVGGSFYTFFHISNPSQPAFESLKADKRSNTKTPNTWQLVLQNTGGGSGTITWDASSFPTGTGSPGVLTINGQDMLTTSSYSFTGDDTVVIYYQAPTNNQPPVAVNDSASTSEGSSVTVNVLENDSDPDGDELTVTSVGTPQNGTATNNGDGTVTYTPNSGFYGADSFTYIINDGDVGYDTATVYITVIHVNNPPVAVNDTVTTDEDTPVDIGVLENDSDPDGDALTVTSIGSPAHGTATDIGDGGIRYSPAENFNGADSFSYVISDGNGETDTAMVYVTVNPVNDPPEITSTPVTSATQGQLYEYQVTATDPDGDVLTYSLTQAPAFLSINSSTGLISGTPGNDDVGSHTVTVQVTDGVTRAADTQTYTLTVENVNDDPIAVNDSATTDEDTQVTIDLLANDSDPDGDDLTVDSVGSPANGTVTDNGDGTVTYTPDENYNGTDSFIYIVSDGNGGLDTATVTVIINPVNDPPVATNDNLTTDEDVPGTVNVLANDSDVDGDALTVSSVGNPSHGLVINNNDGTITYKPDANYYGADSFTYVVSDGNGGLDTATVTVTVNPVNDPPTAVDDTLITDEDTPGTVNVLANDSDVEGDALTVTAVDTPSHGSVVDNGDGTITYTPDANYNGTDSFTYTVSDGNGGNSTATVHVTVNAVNDPPIAADDNLTTDEDTPGTVDVLANDSDVDSDELSVSTVGTPSHGSAVINDDYTITYTPDANYNGTDSFTYVVDDGEGGTDTATVNVTVNPVNDDPVAVDDNLVTDEDTPGTVNVLANDTDVDGDALSVSSVGTPSHGTATDNGDGTITYTPDANYNGTDSFTYTVSDGNGGTATATVNVTINAVNDPPVITSTPVTSATQGQLYEYQVTATDPDGDVLTYSLTQAPAFLSINSSTGLINGTPGNDDVGSHTVTVQVTDGVSRATDTQTYTLTVENVNDAPVAVDDSLTTDEDNPATVNVLANDSDPDGDALTVSSVGTPAHGTVTNNGDGTITYSPAANYNGTDSFTYTVSDGNGGLDTATVHVTVNPVNDAPVAVDDNAYTPEDTPVTVDVLANDSDVDGDSLTVTHVSTPAHGTAIDNGDGTVTYTPDLNYNGTDSFTYTISDGNGGTDSATVTILVNQTNDAPVAVDDSATTSEDSPVTVAVLSNDTDPDGDDLTVTAVSSPSHGTASINGDGTVTYTPSANFFGNDSFDYVASDGLGGLDTATVFITVTPVNDPPVAVDDNLTTDEDTPGTVNVLANDSDVDGDALTVSSVGTPSHGTVTNNGDGTITYTPEADYNGTDSFTYTVSDGNGGLDTATVHVTVNPVNDPPVITSTPITTATQGVLYEYQVEANDPDGDTLTYTLTTAPGFLTINSSTGLISGTPGNDDVGTHTVTVQVSDGVNRDAVTQSYTLTVENVNDPPVAVNDTSTTDEDTPVTVAVLENDSDPDGDALSVDYVGTPSHGTATNNDDGTVTYTPEANFYGSDSFFYVISDGNGASDTAQVVITVNPVNDPPVAVDDNLTTDEDTPGTVNVLANDSDVDGDALTVSSVGTPSHGTATNNGDGTITYTPEANYHGTDSFTYSVSDGNGGTASATVNVTVNPVNDAPVAMDDSLTTQEDTPGTVNVLANDSDVDGDALTVSSVGTPSHGTATNNGDGTITYAPEANYQGADSFTYVVSDGNGGLDTATVHVTVTPVNDPPVITSTPVTTATQGVLYQYQVVATDPDGDPLTYSLTTAPAFLSINSSSGLISGTPGNDDVGSHTVTVEVSDGVNRDVATQTYTLTVQNVNDAPVAVNDTATTDEDTQVMVSVLENDSDPDGDPLSVVSVGAPSHGTATNNNDGSVTYMPAADYFGSDNFTYVVSDGNGGADTATVYITVNAVNDAPVVSDIPDQSVPEGSPFAPIPLDNYVNDVDNDDSEITWTTSPTTHVSITIINHVASIVANDPDWNGSETVIFTATDPDGASDSDSVTFTVTGVNDPPHITSTPVTGATQGQLYQYQVVAEDPDPNDTLTYTLAAAPAFLSINSATGLISGTPAQSDVGDHTVTVVVTDLAGAADVQTYTLTVLNVNDPPTVLDIPDQTIAEGDTFATINLDNYVNDPDNTPDQITWTSSGTTNITVTIQNRKATIVVNDPEWNGSETVVFTAMDPGGLTDSDSATFTVTPVNDPPVVGDIPDQTITEGQNFASFDLDEFVADPDNTPTEISWSVSGNVDLIVNIDTAHVVSIALPDSEWNGSETLVFTATDPGGLSDADTAVFTVNGVNDAPVVSDIPDQTIAEGSSFAQIHLDDYVFDPDNDDSEMSWSYSGNVDLTVSIDANRVATITLPDSNWNGSETIVFTATDPGGLSDADSATFTVTPVNDPPVITSTPVTQAIEDQLYTYQVTATDPDGDPLTYSLGVAPGWLSINASTGLISGTPTNANVGDTTVTVIVDDGVNRVTVSQTYTLTVINVNDPPVVSDIPDQSVMEDESFAQIHLDDYVDDPDNADSEISWTVSSATHFTITIDANRIATVTPVDPEWGGSETVIFTATDPGGLSDSDSATFTVVAVNDTPVVADIPDQQIQEGGVFLPINLDDYVTDPDDPDSVISWTVSSTTHLTVSIANRVAVITVNDPEWNGSETVTFTATDPSGASDSDDATFTVVGVNDPPVLSAIPDVVFDEDDTLSFPVSNWYGYVTDPDNPDSTLNWSFAGLNEVTAMVVGGNFQFWAPENWNGQDSILVIVSDGQLSDTTTVLVVVNSVNDAPVLSLPATISFPEDSSYTIDLDTVVSDVDDPLDSLNWSVQFLNLDESASDSIQLVYDPQTHVLTIIPDSNFYVTNQPLEFTVTDPHGASDTDTVLVSIFPVNDPPVIATLPTFNWDEDDSLSILNSEWYAYVEDPDNPDSALSYTVLPGAQVQVQAMSEGVQLFAPANWFGTDTLCLIVSDGSLADTAQFTVVVNPVNDPPEISGLPDFLEFQADSSVTLNLWDYVSDIETPDSLLLYSFATSNDSLVYNYDGNTGMLTLSASVDFSGAVQFFITVEDDSGATASDTIDVMVQPNALNAWRFEIPDHYVLMQNYPNPFNPTTRIRFGLPQASDVLIEVYNVLGQRVATLLNARKPAGYHEVEFDASQLGSGIYIYRIKAGNFQQVKKMMLMK